MFKNQEKPSPHTLKAQTDWFIEIEDVSSEKRCYLVDEVNTTLRERILNGEHKKNSPVVIQSMAKDGKWNETGSSLFAFAKNHFILRVLYQPVWGYAVAGLKWGVVVGIFLKLLDTLFFLGSVDLTLAFMFLLAIGVLFIPRIGIIPAIAVLIIMLVFTDANLNFFLIGLSSAITGAILGCLPGMAIGGIIGTYLSQKGTLLRAHDAAPEPRYMLIKTVLLPFFGGWGLFIIYIFIVNPWLISVLK